MKKTESTTINLTSENAELDDHFAPFDGLKVHYKTNGSGENTLILVHGWTCNANFWRGQIFAFPGMRVIAVDLPGHGQSSKPQTEYTMRYFARALEAVMRDACVKRAVLVGHSMGAPVVREFYRLYPERTLGLVVVDGGFRPLAQKERTHDKLAMLLQANYNAVAPQIINELVSPIRDEKLKEEVRAAMLSTPDYVAVSAMRGLADDKVYERDSIKVPVLVILAKSPFWHSDIKQFLQSLAPKLEFHMWEAVSHFLMMERPREFNRTLELFLVKHKLHKK